MGDSAMMGRQTGDQNQLFYLFNLEERIPARHLLRRINPIVTGLLADLREKLKPFYSETDRSDAGGSIMRGNLEKRGGPAPFWGAAQAFLLVGGLLLLMLLCGWLYAGTSGAVITTVLGAIALMLGRL